MTPKPPHASWQIGVMNHGRACRHLRLDNQGLISRCMHPEDLQTAIEVRLIEVKGRASVGEVALSANEYRTAGRLGRGYWLYAVFNCSSEPKVHPIQDPARLGWEAVMAVEHYRIGVAELVGAAQ